MSLERLGHPFDPFERSARSLRKIEATCRLRVASKCKEWTIFKFARVSFGNARGSFTVFDLKQLLRVTP